MSYPIFPTIRGLGFPFVKYPEWSTIVQRMTSGKELRMAQWTNPVWHFELNFNFLLDGSPVLLPANYQSNQYTDYRMLLGSFLQNQGQYNAFVFDDPDDDVVTAQNFGTGNGSTVTFQLVRNFGGFSEWIQNLNGPPTIFDNGSTVNPINYSVSTTGQITFNSAPLAGHALTWTGFYYFLCRYEEDSWQNVAKTMGKLWQVDSPLKVKFQSIKL